MLNPSWRSQEQLQSLQCLGKLLGTALRCGIEVEVNLPNLVWRRLAGECPDWKADIKQIDAGLFETLNIVEQRTHAAQQQQQQQHNKDSSSNNSPTPGSTVEPEDETLGTSSAAAVDEALAGRTFVLSSCDGRELQLLPNGRNEALVPSKQPLYLECARKMRLHESALQIEELWSGLSQVIPVEPLALLTCEELTEHVCGRQDVDVELLKSCAV